jgi:hypothetical protein
VAPWQHSYNNNTTTVHYHGHQIQQQVVNMATELQKQHNNSLLPWKSDTETGHYYGNTATTIVHYNGNTGTTFITMEISYNNSILLSNNAVTLYLFGFFHGDYE